MKFMSTWEIDEAVARYRHHLTLGPATRTLANLRDCADRNSDGWAYWPKPARAANKLMQFIDGSHAKLDPRIILFDEVRADATPAKLRQALAPVKAFKTRTKLEFTIEEAGE